MRRTFLASLDEVESAVEWVGSVVPRWVDSRRLDLGLTEAITNAVVHGSDHEAADADVEELDAYFGSVSSDHSDRMIELEVDVADDRLGVELRWNQNPCPPEHRSPREGGVLAGRGMGIIHSAFDRVDWDDDGFCMRMTCVNPQRS